MKRYLSLIGIVLLNAGVVSPARADFIPGDGNAAADCYAGVDVTGVTSSSNRIECQEGDPCDQSPCGDATCKFEVRVCVNEPNVQDCTPPAGGLKSMKAPGPLRSGIPGDLTGESCGQAVTFDLKLKRDGQKKNKRVIRTRATAAGDTQPRKDQDSFTFVCLPRNGDCPSSPSSAFLQ
jgi:hypothetical protein